MSGSFSCKTDIANPTGNTSLDALVTADPGRRKILKDGAALGLFATPTLQLLVGCTGTSLPTTIAIPTIGGFSRISASTADRVRVPTGYLAQVLYRWGDPIGAQGVPANTPAFLHDASNTAAEQALQAGMHHDGMHFFPMHDYTDAAPRGLLVVNHEYTDDGLLHIGGMNNWSAAKVAKSQASHGVSVVEALLEGGEWRVQRPSRYARRITANTPMRISGPVARSAMVKTADDASGTFALGTFANCAHGFTPWGTYLACEENWHGYFSQTTALSDHEKRYGLSATGAGYRWWEFDPRFDVAKNPNEPNRFGWVVEIDPFDPDSLPVKRTAMGRFKHESAMQSIARDGRVVFYMGDDEKFEYVYKFVTRDKWNANDAKANRDLLDHGTLFVARFDDDGSGRWIALQHGTGPLTTANGFASQADVLVRTRQAADALAATKMDRPEWIAVHPQSKEVYCSLTNNVERGTAGKPGTNAANPRAGNAFGHIIRWREKNQDPAATSFDWDMFALAGNGDNSGKGGNISGDLLGSPDGLWFDSHGRLWIETDVSTKELNKDDYGIMGNNQLLVADTNTRDVKRFLTGPAGCEITGITSTPDGRHLFVNIQHPGETPSERSDPAKPMNISSWPDGPQGGRPRSATIVIRREDGGVVGT